MGWRVGNRIAATVEAAALQSDVVIAIGRAQIRVLWVPRVLVRIKFQSDAIVDAAIANTAAAVMANDGKARASLGAS